MGESIGAVLASLLLAILGWLENAVCFDSAKNVHGQRVSQNNYLMDGIDNNSTELAAAGRRAEMVQPSIDAIQEFKVETTSKFANHATSVKCVFHFVIGNTKDRSISTQK
jgi:hypothetical protein